MGKFWVFWHRFFYWKKLVCLKILFFISIRPISLLKMVKKFYYNSPDNAAYASTKRNRKLGIEYCVALVTVKNALEGQFFFDYGYHKDNFKMLYSTRKLKVPNSFKTTILGNTNCSMREELLMNKNSQNSFFICQQPLTETKK